MEGHIRTLTSAANLSVQMIINPALLPHTMNETNVTKPCLEAKAIQYVHTHL